MTFFSVYVPVSESEKTQNEFELDLAAELLQKQVYMRANLPAKLAQLALAGQEREAVRALISWGTGEKPLSEIWEEVKGYIEKR